MPGWIYTHIASGEKRDPMTAARLKRMGVTPGFSPICAIELKAKAGRLSEHQAAIKRHLEQAGHGRERKCRE